MRSPTERWDTSVLWAFARAQQNVLLIQDYAVSAISALLCRTGCLRKDRCRTRWPQQNTIKCHPALFRKSCLSLCTWINLVGQQGTMGVDGLTLFITVLYFSNTIKPWLLSSTHLKYICLHRVLFSWKLVPLHSSPNLICTSALFNGCCLVGLGFCFGSFKTSHGI